MGHFRSLASGGREAGRHDAIRFFLGVFEAAFISGAPYLTTALYPRAVSVPGEKDILQYIN